jgi:hypothetical protein
LTDVDNAPHPACAPGYGYGGVWTARAISGRS